MAHNNPKESDKWHRGDEPHLLREIIRTHQVMMHSLSRHLGMPASQWALLRALANADGAVGIMDLARMLGVNAAAVTRQVQGMEAEGLIRRRPDGRDKRRHHVCLSAKGLKTFEEIHARSHCLERALSEAVPAAEMSSAAQIMARVREFIEDYREEKVREPET